MSATAVAFILVLCNAQTARVCRIRISGASRLQKKVQVGAHGILFLLLAHPRFFGYPSLLRFTLPLLSGVVDAGPLLSTAICVED